MGLALFLISAFTPLPNILGRSMSGPSALGPAEAIVVLGGGVMPDGVLSNSSMRRALHGILLHRKGLAPMLVFFGPMGDGGPAEADVRAELARELGVSPGVILTAADAWTTREEALRGGALLQAKGVRRILLVTDAYHMRRARALFEQAGFEVVAAPTYDISSRVVRPEDRLTLMRRIVEERLARLYYGLAGYL
ncbi:MAG: YdcF family protein [candidate division NC10 bacterium]|nr:YdcF family protein [candidate division NC10 bacterium]